MLTKPTTEDVTFFDTLSLESDEPDQLIQLYTFVYVGEILLPGSRTLHSTDGPTHHHHPQKDTFQKSPTINAHDLCAIRHVTRDDSLCVRRKGGFEWSWATPATWTVGTAIQSSCTATASTSLENCLECPELESLGNWPLTANGASASL
ncbi:hypothetical protein CROQUDRAFT_90272 [Cronartium quercuum f. sp. fusiforme G11]|uniref:Uncharacterized protein n=1 Tax=Cronartium quercuum f. sp. fusiforme G11 TaxID=708437 RepID=A0A9P6NM93_9BASI|nr:hypothetical protein CROQUDRAFT_90272 [Cronartium quercuum f. sp. fusiforme G11]